MNRKQALIFVLVLVLGAVVFAPWQRVNISPAIRARVLDEDGNPANGVLVVQEWEYMSVGSHFQQQSALTDDAGYVTFLPRSTRISIAIQALSILREIVSLPHGYGFGRRAQVSAYGADPHVWSFVYCSTSDPPCDTIRMKRWATALYPRRT